MNYEVKQNKKRRAAKKTNLIHKMSFWNKTENHVKNVSSRRVHRDYILGQNDDPQSWPLVLNQKICKITLM